MISKHKIPIFLISAKNSFQYFDVKNSAYIVYKSSFHCEQEMLIERKMLIWTRSNFWLKRCVKLTEHTPKFLQSIKTTGFDRFRNCVCLFFIEKKTQTVKTDKTSLPIGVSHKGLQCSHPLGCNKLWKIRCSLPMLYSNMREEIYKFLIFLLHCV